MNKDEMIYEPEANNESSVQNGNAITAEPETAPKAETVKESETAAKNYKDDYKKERAAAKSKASSNPDLKKKILLYALAMLVIFALSLGAGFLYGYFSYKAKNANAEELNVITPTLYSPDDYYLYQKLVSPKYSYETDGYFAVLENGDDKHVITVYDKNEKIYHSFKAEDYGLSNFTNIGKIAIYSSKKGDYVIFQYDLKLFSINIKTGKKANVVTDTDPSSALTLRSFDYNGKYFIVAKDNTVNLFGILSDEPDSIILSQMNVSEKSNQQSCVAINDDFYFYNVNSTIHKVSLAGFIDDESTPANSSISSMAACSDKLFFISDGNVMYLTTSDFKAVPQTAVKNTSSSLLGNVGVPESVSVYKDQLAIVDATSSTVQYFSTDAKKDFAFTGKAVATNEKTYNRINKATTATSLYGKNVAFLSKGSVKVVDIATGVFTDYGFDYGNFDNIALLSLGESSVAISNGANVVFRKFASDEWIVKDVSRSDPTTIYASAYIFGNYYFLSTGASGDYLIVFDEETFTLNRRKINIEKGIIGSGCFMTVDADGYLYIYVKSSNSVHKYEISEEFDLTLVNDYAVSFGNLEYALSTSVDLCGNFYALSNNDRIAKLSPDGTVKFFNLKLSVNLTENGGVANKKASSFAMNYDNKSAFIVYSEQSFILTTDLLENESADNILKPEGLTLSSSNGNAAISKVSVTGKSAFKVNLSKELVFGYEKQLFATDKEYLIIATTVNGYSVLLAGDDYGDTEILLVKTSELSGEQVSPTDENKLKVVSSAVNLYYYPVITQANSCCINDEAVIRLKVGDVIKIEKSFDFNGKEYYFVQCSVNGNDYSGFVPSSFTADGIVNKTKPEDYRIEKVNDGAKIYDENLIEVDVIDNVSSVKVGSSKDGYATVVYKKDGAYRVGLIKESDILTESSDSLKNFLLISLSTFALFVVAVFFINKKKTYVSEN